MGFKKKEEVQRVSHARKRYAGLVSIDNKRGKIINYGLEDSPLTQTELKRELDTYTEAIKTYNQILQQADTQSDLLQQMESKISRMSTLILRAAPAKFGEDSEEIVMLGGTRAADRKKPVRKPKAS